MNKQAYQDAAVYVGTYGKYNRGSIAGKWLRLEDYADKDEFIEACHELHEDEEDPELMFQDWEHIPEGLISECGISEKFFELRDELTEGEEDAFTQWLGYSNYGIEGDASALVECFRDEFCGEWESEEEYAEEVFNELYLPEVPEHIRYYIDYKAFARDLFMDGYSFYSGYVFRHI